MKEIKDIVIVGGGTAGWMTAATLIKFFPNKNIRLIESNDIATVGVGESTIAEIKNWLKALDIKDTDFMKECDASYKMAIKFTDFYDKDYGSFYYPFGGPYLENTYNGTLDWHVLKNNNSDLDLKDYIRSYYSAASLFEQNKISDKDTFDNFHIDSSVVYHFDASRFGLWLKDKYAKPKGVKHIISTIKNIKTNNMGIEYLILEDGRNVKSDIFIDCTGFQSLLLNKTLKEEFISKEDVLPNNHAWAVQLPYKNKKIELEPFTNCTAISNGWCWNIPLWSRLGTGYVYSDKYISSEKALEEFKQYLMSDKMIVPRTESEIENLNFKNIKMRVGIHKRTWVNNVVAIGLSAGFIEPLESNGLFTVHEFLFKLVDNIEQWDMDKYNKETYEIYDDFLKFVALHYAFSKREDSQYWRDIVKNKDVVDIKKSYNYSHHGIKAIMVGMNHIFDTPIKNVDQIKDNLNNNKNKWSLQASSEPTLYEFLNNLYK